MKINEVQINNLPSSVTSQIWNTINDELEAGAGFVVSLKRKREKEKGEGEREREWNVASDSRGGYCREDKVFIMLTNYGWCQKLTRVKMNGLIKGGG